MLLENYKDIIFIARTAFDDSLGTHVADTYNWAPVVSSVSPADDAI